MRHTYCLSFVVILLCSGCSQPDEPSAVAVVLDAAVEQGRIPGAIAVAASSDRVIFEDAAGARDLSEGTPMSVDTIVRIASQTKAITSVAVMQLVESGKLDLDAPASEYLPRLADIEVLEGFDEDGKPVRRPPTSQATVRQLLTHTSGYVYEIWNSNAARSVALGLVPSILAGGDGFTYAPLAFDPGTRWEYGISTDILGIIVEEVSGQSLDEYFRQQIFEPLKMPDTFFDVPEDKANRVATVYSRASDGKLTPVPMALDGGGFRSGGGGLFSTASDYTRFMRSLLNGGELDGARILSSSSVDLMAQNQIGELEVPDAVQSPSPALSNDVDFKSWRAKKFGLGFIINTDNGPDGRSKGSLSWAGLYNSYYWIDREKNVCGVLITQILPFYDADVVALMSKFESAVYAELERP
jgi:methyl acetate hydrolase